MTTRCVAFLRGINVGGRRITGDEMAALAVGAGFDGAQSYQASGNLVIDSDAPRDEVEDRLSQAFAAVHGWDVDVFVRTVDELRAVLAAVPFSADEVCGLGKPQVGFAHAPVDISSLSVERDLVAAVGTEVYWVPHTGVSDADLEMADFARAAGSITIRTMGTVERIVAKFAT